MLDMFFFLISLTCSVLSPDDYGFPGLPGLATEAQEAQVARLFPCREALFSTSIPDSFLSVLFCCLSPYMCLHAIWRPCASFLLVLPPYFPLFSLNFLMKSYRLQYKSKSSRRNDIRASDKKWSTPTGNRRRRHRCVLRVRSIPFYFGRGFILHLLPRPCLTLSN